MRVALDWAMSREGDPELGAALAKLSACLAFQLACAEESMRGVDAARDAIGRLGKPARALGPTGRPAPGAGGACRAPPSMPIPQARSGRKPSRSSVANAAGCSQAAKWPPLASRR